MTSMITLTVQHICAFDITLLVVSADKLTYLHTRPLYMWELCNFILLEQRSRATCKSIHIKILYFLQHSATAAITKYRTVVWHGINHNIQLPYRACCECKQSITNLSSKKTHLRSRYKNTWKNIVATGVPAWTVDNVVRYVLIHVGGRRCARRITPWAGTHAAFYIGRRSSAELISAGPPAALRQRHQTRKGTRR